MSRGTICWSCNEHYSNDLDRCPSCEATNANKNPDKALAESKVSDERMYSAIAAHLGYAGPHAKATGEQQ